MTEIVWEEKYSVRVARFDAEHKNLIKILNELLKGILENRTQEILAPILGRLVAYTETHFKSEEKAMKELGYPDYPKHLKEHEEFAQRVRSFAEEYHAGRAVLGFSILKFLYEWLIYHIEGSDAAYSGFFQEKGFR